MRPRGLARDTLLNLAGQILPLGVAVVAVPAVVAGLGTERFGILALAWGVLGSFSVLDLALGRAVTRLAAAALGRGEEARLPALAWSAALLQAGLGIAAGLAFAAATPALVGRLAIPDPLAGEARAAFLLLSLSFPFTLVTGAWRSLLEALRRFDLINLMRVPAGAATFAVPWLGVVLGWSLPEIVGALVATRAAVTLIHGAAARHALPTLGRRPRLERAVLGEIARFGGWLTAANTVPPLLNLLDRFAVGALVSLSAVAWFSVPSEMVLRLWVLPTSLVAALFPLLAAAAGRDDPAAVRTLARGAVRTILLLLGLPVLVAVAGARPILETWLGGDFATAGAPVLRLLALGFLASALASPMAAALQAVGRPDLTARLRLAELPVFALLLWVCVQRWGATGAALASALRSAVDAACLCVLAARRL